MKTIHLLITVLALLTLLATASPAPAEDAAPGGATSDKVQVGVYYFPNW